MELREALSHIAEIKARVAATERFRGYRAVPVGFSGLAALLAAVAQTRLITDPVDDPIGYLTLWMITAIVAVTIAGSSLVYRHWTANHPLSREMTILAVTQFAPCLAAGALVTVAIARHSPEMVWILPGVWQVLFSLGIFASCRLLPQSIIVVGVFYLASGTLNIAFGGTLSPWSMGVPFGIGQLATAIILYWNLERNPEEVQA